MKNEKAQILIVDDDPAALAALERVLRHDFQTITATSPDQGLALLEKHLPAILLTDFQMPGMSGEQFLEKVRVASPSTIRTVISGYMDLEHLGRLINHQLLHRFFLKPWENDVLKIQLLECLSHHQLLLEKQTLEHLSITDPLTQISNRRYFQDQLLIEIERAKRHQRHLCLLMIDVDGFKSFNDNKGHPEGDHLLRLIAQHLSKGIRNIDLVFRYGGDEFSILLPDTPVNGAYDVAERLRVGFSNLGLGVTLSIGVAGLSPMISTKESLVEAADRALYTAKNQGRNQSIIAPHSN